MFLRWQSRTRVRKAGPDARVLGDAGVVRWWGVINKAMWIDGKPRQQHVACLISFTEVELGKSFADHRARLWLGVLQRLDALGERVTPADRKRIEAAVAEKLPRPSEAKLACAREERRAHVE